MTTIHFTKDSDGGDVVMDADGFVVAEIDDLSISRPKDPWRYTVYVGELVLIGYSATLADCKQFCADLLG